MESVVLVIHLFLALAIIGFVLLQRSEGGGLGIGGGGGGLGNVASAQGMDNFLTKATSFCAVAFFCTSLTLGVLAGRSTSQNQNILDSLTVPAVSETIELNTEEAQETPSVPIAE